MLKNDDGTLKQRLLNLKDLRNEDGKRFQDYVEEMLDPKCFCAIAHLLGSVIFFIHYGLIIEGRIQEISATKANVRQQAKKGN